MIRSEKRGFYLFRYRDPETGRWREETSAIPASPRKRAEAYAAALARERAIFTDRSPYVTWGEFDERYREECLSGLSRGSLINWLTVKASLDKFAASRRPVVRLETLDQLDAAFLSTWAAWLRGHHPETTIKSYLGTLRPGLKWAARVGLIEKAPAFPTLPKVKRSRGGRKKMRSRPITGEELERMLAVVPKVRQKHPEPWKRLLRGLWLSGLRVSEAVILSWDWTADFSVDLDKRCFHILAEAHKSGDDRDTPMAPEFVAFLQETPLEQRQGLVFPLGVTANQASRVIGLIGRKAGVRVSNKGKTASAHDLRRSFGTRWAPKVHPAVLQILMRHADIATTMAFYVGLDAAAIAQQLGEIVGETPPNRASTKRLVNRRKSLPGNKCG